ncbi:translation initiation factor IF-5A [Candidatus Woesearchaeota archaeon CG_4_10_14_0_2_um_filter_57_5]|nr:MAG: translation initiation factor IF-5A [Candidatus Woesearchaeota archaeon CG1_02_57_44]PIN69027.1 MAG: translation initiation factor IF-5A [Candidatus Woesearchaeota archaeon CG11_big_fil_rev_8_21_14_0_20_57_5]PIZ56831.1 MAG: translation initiation factor IF-5A [Candidatus Woesearchaeota archaeon CG_4_10_14_0_2_um_filter_57_5]
MSTKPVSASYLKKGSYVVIDGEPSKVSNLSVSRPGKHGHAKIRIEAVGLFDDKKRDLVMPGHDSVDVPILEKRNAQVLAVMSEKVSVMDMESFEQFELDVPDEFKDQLTEGQTVLFWQIMGRRVLKQLKGE